MAVGLREPGVGAVEVVVASGVAEVAAGERGERVAGVHGDGVGGEGEGPADLQDGVVGEPPAARLGAVAVEVEDLAPAQGVAQLGRGDVPQALAGGDDVDAAGPGRGVRRGVGRGVRRCRGHEVRRGNGRGGRGGACGESGDDPADQHGSERAGRAQHGGPASPAPGPGLVGGLGDNGRGEDRPDDPAHDDQQTEQQPPVVRAQQRGGDLVEAGQVVGQERAAEHPQRDRDPGQQRRERGQRRQAPHDPQQSHGGPPASGVVATSWACADPVLVMVSTPTRPSSTVGVVAVTSTWMRSPVTVTVAGMPVAAR